MSTGGYPSSDRRAEDLPPPPMTPPPGSPLVSGEEMNEEALRAAGYVMSYDDERPLSALPEFDAHRQNVRHLMALRIEDIITYRPITAMPTIRLWPWMDVPARALPHLRRARAEVARRAVNVWAAARGADVDDLWQSLDGWDE